MKAFYPLSIKGRVTLDMILDSLIKKDELAIRCLTNEDCKTRDFLLELAKEIAETKVEFKK